MSLSIGEPMMVDTFEIDVLADEVSALSMRCGLLSAEASAARALTAPPNASSRWSTAGPRIDDAAEELARAADKTAALARSLGAASGLYVDAETTVNGLFNTASAVTGAFGGALFFNMVTPLIGVAIATAPASIGIGYALSQHSGVRSAFTRIKATLGESVTAWLQKHPDAARNPLTMLLVRGIVAGSDDTLRGALGIPPTLAAGMQDSPANVPAFACALGALGVGSLAESAVSVTRAGRSTVAPPSSISDLAQRIPDSSPGTPQIRIEKYGEPGEESWAIYVGGTVDMTTADTDEAFDFESDVALMADADGGGYRAVVQAMRDAGISADDSVTIVGHSQGGLIAERVAQEGHYNVDTVVTFGAPTTDADLPEGVTAYAVEHRDDVVPALGGFSDGSERVVVSGDSTGEGDDWLSAHAMSEYERTAEAMDMSSDPRMDPLKDAVSEIGSDDGTSTMYRATRDTDPPMPPTPAEAAPPQSDEHADAHRDGSIPVRPQDADLSGPTLEEAHASAGGESRGGTDAPELDRDSGASGSDHQIDTGLVDDGDETKLIAGPHVREHVGRLGPLPSPMPLPDEVEPSGPRSADPAG